MSELKKKVAIIGAGNVGSSLAMIIAQSGLAAVVLMDIYKNIAQAKALDIIDALSVFGRDGDVKGTDDYAEIRDAEVVVVTAGIPRKPGMQRKDLIATNASIVKMVVKNIKKSAPRAIILMVTNPLDAMTYHALTISGFPKQRVLGMAGVLDGARMMTQIAKELNVSISAIETIIMGSHGKEMVPVFSHTKVNLENILGGFLKPSASSKKKVTKLFHAARDRGAEIVRLLGKGSAYFAPSASIFKMLKAILDDTHEVMAASVYLEGEYGLKDICIGVPVVINANGIESIVEIDLDKKEKGAFLEAEKMIRETLALL